MRLGEYMTQQSETEQITLLIEQGSRPLLKSACACPKFLLTINVTLTNSATILIM